MPDKEEVQKAFETITKKATEIDKRLNTTIGATKQRSLIKESLDQEIIFGLAGVTLTVDGTARVDLLNKHTFKADDKTKQDPDGILGTKPEEDVDDTLWPQIPFRPDQTWLKYRVYPGFPTPFRGFAWVIRWESPCGSSWKTRSVFQGAVGAFGASTVPSASTGPVRVRQDDSQGGGGPPRPRTAVDR